MSTAVTYRQAMKELGVSRSTVERWLRVTRIPKATVDGQIVFDLETLIDAWAGHQEAVEAARLEKAGPEKVTESSITIPVPQSMRDELDALAARNDVSLATVVRELLGSALG